jgi:hypothetical protein
MGGVDVYVHIFLDVCGHLRIPATLPGGKDFLYPPDSRLGRPQNVQCADQELPLVCKSIYNSVFVYTNFEAKKSLKEMIFSHVRAYPFIE